MTENPNEKINTEKNEEYENFEKLARELLNMPPEDIKKLLEEEKEQGIEEESEESPNS